MKSPQLKTIAALSTALLATAAFAQTASAKSAAPAAAPVSPASKDQMVDFDHATGGATAFHAVGHPSAIKINGTAPAPKGSAHWTPDGKASGDLLLDLNALDTGIDMRTKHMKEKYLEVEKYPQAKLTLTEIALPVADFVKTDFSESNVAFKGTLTFHGVTKPVKDGVAKIERHGGNAVVHAEFTLRITDYAIALPTFAGITVADDVSIVIDANAPYVAQ